MYHKYLLNQIKRFKEFVRIKKASPVTELYFINLFNNKCRIHKMFYFVLHISHTLQYKNKIKHHQQITSFTTVYKKIAKINCTRL